MDVKQSLPSAFKNDGSPGIPQEPGLGAKLPNGTYYFECSAGDAPYSSIHFRWDASIAVVLSFQDSNLPPFKSANAMVAAPGAADVSLIDETAGNWITEDPSTAYVPFTAGAGSVVNMTVTVASSTAGGAMVNMGNLGTRRGRIKAVVTNPGFLRVAPHGKSQ